MSNRALFIYAVLVSICVAALFFAQFLPTLDVLETETYVTYYGTRGSAVEHNKKPWTLNFEQQNAFISYINEGHNIEYAKKDSSLFPYSRIIIYQFGKPDLIFTPISIVNDNIVFEAPSLVNTGYIQEGSNGKLKELLTHTYAD